GGNDRGRLGHGGIRLAAEQRALSQGRPVHPGVLHQVPRTSEAASAPEMEGRESGGQSAGLDTIWTRTGRVGAPGCGWGHDRKPAWAVRCIFFAGRWEGTAGP